jgi:hypothetical protein
MYKKSRGSSASAARAKPFPREGDEKEEEKENRCVLIEDLSIFFFVISSVCAAFFRATKTNTAARETSNKERKRCQLREETVRLPLHSIDGPRRG